MKYTFKILLALIALQAPIYLQGIVITELKVNDPMLPNIIERVRAHEICDIQPYISGGVTFNYPTQIFSVIPSIRFTIEKISALPSDTVTYCPIISANSTTSATIIVHKIVNSSPGVTDITEASTGEVIIHFFAAGA